MPEYVVRTRPGTTTTRVQRPGGTTRVRTRLATGGGGGGVSAHNLLSGRSTVDAHPISSITGLQDALDAAGGGGSVAVVAVAVGDGGEDIDLDGAGPDDVGLVLVWGRSSGNGVYDVSVADGWVLVDPQPSTVIAQALVDGSTFMPVLNSGVWSLYTYTDGDWVALGAVPNLGGNSGQVWGTTGWFTPDSGGPDLSDTTPQALGTAAAGAGTAAARDDHVHAMPTAADVGADPAGTAAGLVDDLSGVSNQSTARSNLGLGTAATADTGTGASNVILGNDSRLTDARTPTVTVKDLPQTGFVGTPIAGFAGGAVAVAIQPGTLILAPAGQGFTGIARFWWSITATSATSGQNLHFVVYSPTTGGNPGSLLWSQAFDAATAQNATVTTPSPVIPPDGWWGVLFPSTLAGGVTMRFGYPATQQASNFSTAYSNMACSFAATSQGATPAASLSSYTFGMTPAATVLGANHAVRPCCPLIFLKGS